MNDTVLEAGTLEPKTNSHEWLAKIGESMAAAQKKTYWSSSRGRWTRLRDYVRNARGTILHSNGDPLGEFVHPADADHAVLWQPHTIALLIERDNNALSTGTWSNEELARMAWFWEQVLEQVNEREETRG